MVSNLSQIVCWIAAATDCNHSKATHLVCRNEEQQYLANQDIQESVQVKLVSAV